MKIFNKDGIEMMDVKSIGKADDNLVLKGKMMGSMATVILVRPEDLWGAFQLLSWKTRLAMPLLLLKGWRASVKKIE